MGVQGGEEEVNGDTDLPFKELGCLLSKNCYRRNIFGGGGGENDFRLGNNEFKKPVKHLRVYELICQMQL